MVRWKDPQFREGAFLLTYLVASESPTRRRVLFPIPSSINSPASDDVAKLVRSVQNPDEDVIGSVAGESVHS